MITHPPPPIIFESPFLKNPPFLKNFAHFPFRKMEEWNSHYGSVSDKFTKTDHNIILHFKVLCNAISKSRFCADIVVYIFLKATTTHLTPHCCVTIKFDTYVKWLQLSFKVYLWKTYKKLMKIFWDVAFFPNFKTHYSTFPLEN